MYDKEKRVDLNNLHVSKVEETVCIDAEEKKQIIVETPLGSLVIYQSGDPEYPGVYIDLRREGFDLDAPLAMVEYTPDEGDLKEPAIVTRVWDDVREEDHQTRVVHSGIEEYFKGEIDE